jgi:mRNA-degrading endonuclease toxin of MazEF toxin-antitoxin module
MVINQGDIYWIDLEEPSGSEPGYRHPHVVVQSNLFNRSEIRTVVVCALTSNLKRASAPGNVLLGKKETNLPKDSVVNAEQSGEFVYNMATYELREAVNLTAQQVPPEVDEFELAGLAKAPSRLVKAPRVAESPIHFECRYHQTVRLPGNGTMGTVDIVIGEVIGIHIKDEFIQPDPFV